MRRGSGIKLIVLGGLSSIIFFIAYIELEVFSSLWMVFIILACLLFTAFLISAWQSIRQSKKTQVMQLKTNNKPIKQKTKKSDFQLIDFMVYTKDRPKKIEDIKIKTEEEIRLDNKTNSKDNIDNDLNILL